MAEAVKDRGPSGSGSVVFRQNLEYPKAPGQITYYPPEPSDDLKKQVRSDRGGGVALYVMGLVITMIGFFAAMEFSDAVEVYAVLIPLLLILGLVFALMFLKMNNVALAKLSRTLPMILVICLILMYIFSIFSAVMDLNQMGENPSENQVSDAFEKLFMSLLNPAFFMMTTGVMICISGGTMLWTSTKIMNEFIPGMIIIEASQTQGTTMQQPVAVQDPPSQSPGEEKLCEHCGKPLDYIEAYSRYYCHDCQEYAPKDT